MMDLPGFKYVDMGGRNSAKNEQHECLDRLELKLIEEDSPTHSDAQIRQKVEEVSKIRETLVIERVREDLLCLFVDPDLPLYLQFSQVGHSSH